MATDALAVGEVARHEVRLVVVDRARGTVRVVPFGALPSLLRAGDLVVVNDAATLPASLFGATSRGEPFELRLSAPIAGRRLWGVLFGEGDYHVRTEDRPAPPRVEVGDRLRVATMDVVVEQVEGRRVTLAAALDDDELWRQVYAAGVAVQYAHRAERLPLYAVQTAYATRPWAVEMPSAGRALTWDVLLGLRREGIGLATLTHAAGLSSTGDAELDRALPWPERYEIPATTIEAIRVARERAGRVIAIGTTVVRAVESAAVESAAVEPGTLPRSLRPRSAIVATVVAGAGIATLRLDPAYRPRVVDGLVSGLHVPGESHFELLSAFAPRPLLVKALAVAAACRMSRHELGDALLLL